MMDWKLHCLLMMYMKNRCQKFGSHSRAGTKSLQMSLKSVSKSCHPWMLRPSKEPEKRGKNSTCLKCLRLEKFQKLQFSADFGTEVFQDQSRTGVCIHFVSTVSPLDISAEQEPDQTLIFSIIVCKSEFSLGCWPHAHPTVATTHTHKHHAIDRLIHKFHMFIPDLSLDHVEGYCEELIDTRCVWPVAHVMPRAAALPLIGHRCQTLR